MRSNSSDPGDVEGDLDIESNSPVITKAVRRKKSVEDFEEDEEEREFSGLEEDEDFQQDKKKNAKKKTTKAKVKAPKKETVKKQRKPKRISSIKSQKFDKNHVDRLAQKNVENYWAAPENARPIDLINSDHPLRLKSTIHLQGAIYAMELSPDYKFLAACTNLGAIHIWDTTDWKLVTELRDKKVRALLFLCPLSISSLFEVFLIRRKKKGEGNRRVLHFDLD